MWLESIRPRPSPLPAGLVVTKGSNMRWRTSEAIAGPLLLMAMRQRAACPSSLVARIRIDFRSTLSTASSAFATMLHNSCSSRV